MMEQSPLIEENSGCATIQIYRFVKSSCADAHLSACLIDSLTRLRLIKGKGNLLLSKSGHFHGIFPFALGEISCWNFYTFEWLGFSGQGNCVYHDHKSVLAGIGNDLVGTEMSLSKEHFAH